MHDPVNPKDKRRSSGGMLDFDAWLDSSLFEFGQAMGRGWTRVQDFMQIFRVTGFRRFATEILSDGMSFFAIGCVLMLALALPAFESTASGRVNPAEDIAVVFLDRYGNEVGRRGIRTDDSVALDKLPDYLIKATLATEDRRFYDHFGVDVIGTARALFTNASGETSLHGGSSITQQLAKQLFLSSERTIERKIVEAFLAVWLEWHYTKDEILKLYLDRSYMGGGNFGVAAAADYYFGKPVTEISLAEAAMLGGLFKAPGRWAPHIDLAAARGRANVVLSNMVAAGFLTEGQVTAARRNPATPVDRTQEINAPNYFLDWAFDETKRLVQAAGSTAPSFVVRTTIDPQLQAYAEEAITSTLREQGEQYRVSEGAMVVTEPTGPIRAMVGGVDYGKSQFNRAIVSTRQPGSSFKPFVYANTLEAHPDYKPTTVVSGATRCIGDWCPRNYSGNQVGRISLINAFAQSINTVPVNLSIDTGRQPIADLAHAMGIRNDFPVTRSLPLGSASVSVLDMTSAYSVFANGGYRTQAYGITRINTVRGDTVFEYDDAAPRQRILSEQTVAYMNEMMRAVVTNGTGRRAQIEGVPTLGKTGTTSDYRDAWFCGLTGNYVASVWLGNDDFSRTRDLTGGLLPTIAWQKFMAYAHTNVEVKPVLGVDFAPQRVIIASTDAATPAPDAQRPPTLTPGAAQKLLDVADRLRASMRVPLDVAQEPSLAAPTPAPGTL